jgi:hypothetical protein
MTNASEGCRKCNASATERTTQTYLVFVQCRCTACQNQWLTPMPRAYRIACLVLLVGAVLFGPWLAVLVVGAPTATLLLLDMRLQAGVGAEAAAPKRLDSLDQLSRTGPSEGAQPSLSRMPVQDGVHHPLSDAIDEVAARRARAILDWTIGSTLFLALAAPPFLSTIVIELGRATVTFGPFHSYHPNITKLTPEGSTLAGLAILIYFTALASFGGRRLARAVHLSNLVTNLYSVLLLLPVINFVALAVLRSRARA